MVELLFSAMAKYIESVVQFYFSMSLIRCTLPYINIIGLQFILIVQHMNLQN